MAKSPAHKFGQIIGHLTEDIMYPLLLKYCNKNKLYLDKSGARPARKGHKLSWVDKYGNTHDLDFVIEKKGTREKVGTPVAFIESAWRRYTKHSRNKAQEIQGALLPLFETYSESKPFIGSILSGVFTAGALNQLKSHGFSILYFEYDEILKAFASIGMDIYFDEKTPLSVFNSKNQSITKLKHKQYNKVIQYLINKYKVEIDNFFKALSASVSRQVCSIRIFNLYGQYNDYLDIKSAIKAVHKISLKAGPMKFIKMEIIIKFDNEDRVDGSFSNKKSALRFLRFFGDKL